MDGLLASQSGIRDSPGPENFIFFCLAMMPIHFSHHGGINLTNPSLCPRGPSAAKDKGERLQQSRTNLTRTAVTKATVKRLAAFGTEGSAVENGDIYTVQMFDVKGPCLHLTNCSKVCALQSGNV